MKQFKIFISSVQSEFEDERIALKTFIESDKLLRNYFDVFLFENLPAKGAPSEKTYLKEIARSDIFILLLGKEYGDAGADGISPIEREFSEAINKKLCILTYIKNGSIKGRDAGVVNLINRIKDSKSGFIYKTFTNIDELKDAVYDSLFELFRGNTRIEFIDSREIVGPLYKVLDEVEIFFKRNTRLASKIVEFKRVDIPEYPFEAIREAVINAMAHRDYLREGANIQIDIFDDRIEVTSPGELLPGLDIKNLKGSHETRNKKICEIFHETKDMERYGTGIRKMRNYMVDYGLKAPEFSEPGKFFRVTFYGPQDKILDLVPSIPEERQTDLKKLGLNERQIEALRMMVNEGKVMTNREYRKLFSVTNKTASTDLNGLVKFEMAKCEGSGRNVRYFAK